MLAPQWLVFVLEWARTPFASHRQRSAVNDLSVLHGKRLLAQEVEAASVGLGRERILNQYKAAEFHAPLVRSPYPRHAWRVPLNV
mmetsp:Transcript_16550/g.45078  ORF Transcript_16550/g.45078 Transcript_16550/m.45078 type:complete len:85 (+) Transcript_16550:2368-2622(+)